MKNTVGTFPDPEIPSTDVRGLMVPPWRKYPNIPRQSIGWRMGIGEQYFQEFSAWWHRQPRRTRLAVRNSYPEPEQWSGFFQGL
jgi:hypothetical protein